METETILQQLYSFAESKDSELYKKAKIILDSIRETLQVNTIGMINAWAYWASRNNTEMQLLRDLTNSKCSTTK